jgi:hypothetical protein
MVRNASFLALGVLVSMSAASISNNAHAGLTVSSAYVDLDAGGATASSFDASVASTGLSAVGGNSSLVLSAFTASGFSLAATSDGSEIWSVFGSTFGFSVDEATTVVLSGNIDAASGTVFLLDSVSSAVLFLRGEGVGAWSSGEINLAAGGSYIIGVNGPFTFANGGTESGMVLDFAVIPAPSAFALLGVAGMMSTRRRR